MASTNAFREVNPEKGLDFGLKLEEPAKDENKNCSLGTVAETSLDQGVRNLRLESAEKGIDSGKHRSKPGDRSDELSNPWKEKMEKFAGETTLHGAPKIILAPTPATRTGWLLVVLCSWSIFLYQVVLVCDNYFRFPKKTNVEIVNDKIAFPGVTFCSHRGVSFYDAEEWSMERIMWAPPPRNPSKNDVDYYEYDDLPDRRPEFQLVYHDVIRDLKFIDPVFWSRAFQSRVRKSAITREELFLKLHALIGSSEFQLHQLSDFDIKQIDGGEFLSCYTVEIPKSSLFQIRSLRGNLMIGRGLVSKASNDKMYIWNSMPTRGEVRVYIHPPGMNIDPRFEKKYFDVQPDQLTVFSVTAKEFIRVGLPHGNCSKQNPFKSEAGSGSESPYSQDECERLCCNAKLRERHNWVSMKCPPLDDMSCWVDENNIQEPDDPSNEARGSHVKRYCNYTTTDESGKRVVKTVGAVPPWRVDFIGQEEDCPCYPSCTEVEYEVSFSAKMSPFQGKTTEFFNKMFVMEEEVQINGHNIPTNYSGRFRLRADYVRNESTGKNDVIYFPGNDGKFQHLQSYLDKNGESAMSDIVSFEINIVDNKIIRTIETPLYTPTQLLSEIGGQLGIWIGVSVITLVEVIELLIGLIRGCFNGKGKIEFSNK